MNKLNLSRRIVDVNGYCYSSIENLNLFKNKLEDEKIYQKYFTIIKRIFLFCKQRIENNQIKLTKEFRNELFEKFRYKIEKFCMINFYITHPSVFLDTFNRTIYDIFYRLRLIKIN